MPLGRTLLRSVPKAADFDFILQPSKPFTYGLQMDVFLKNAFIYLHFYLKSEFFFS